MDIPDVLIKETLVISHHSTDTIVTTLKMFFCCCLTTFQQIFPFKINQILYCCWCFHELECHRVKVVLVSDTMIVVDWWKDERWQQQQQKPEVPSVPQPGCSKPSLCSFLSVNLTEGMKVCCVTAKRSGWTKIRERKKQISEVQWSDLCLCGWEQPLFVHISLPCLLFFLASSAIIDIFVFSSMLPVFTQPLYTLLCLIFFSTCTLSLFSQTQNQDPCVFNLALIPHEDSLLLLKSVDSSRIAAGCSAT